jgi:hypothetical protein
LDIPGWIGFWHSYSPLASCPMHISAWGIPSEWD